MCLRHITISHVQMISDCVRVMIADYVRDISQASLLEILVALHCAYSDNKAYFTILSELVFQLPTIIVNIKANTESIPEIKVHNFICNL